tara:strand:- start:972 stop:1103 length:132 start_codon:yes stop_codon:yes gene_type:complete
MTQITPLPALTSFSPAMTGLHWTLAIFVLIIFYAGVTLPFGKA